MTPPAPVPTPDGHAEAGARGRGPILLALLVATFLVGLDHMVIATAMPTIIGEFGAISFYGWVFSAYLLSSTVTVPLYGKLADLYGRKPVFLASTAIFLAGSMLCGQAQSMEQLILFRLLQGIGAGGVQPVTLTIIGDVFPLAERARIMGVFGTMWGVSSLLGPAIGGFLTEQVSWRWAFYVNLPFSLLSMGLVWRFLRERVRRRDHRLDYAGALLLSAAVVALLLALQLPASPGEGPAGQTLPLSAGLLAVAAVLFAAFLWQERRASEPLLPLALFRQRTIGVGSATAFLVGVLLFGNSAFVPPFVQGVLGASPTVAGLVVAPLSVAWPAASTVSGRLLLHWGYRAVGLVGGALLVAGFGLLGTLQAGDSVLKVSLIGVVIGAGFGFLVPVLLLCMQNAVGWEQRGVVTSANQFARSIGGTIGVSVAGAVFAAALAAQLGPGVAVDPNEVLQQAGRAALQPEELARLQVGLADALRVVYLLLTAGAALALAAAALLPGGRPEQHAWRGQRPLEQAQRSEPEAATAVRR